MPPILVSRRSSSSGGDPGGELETRGVVNYASALLLGTSIDEMIPRMLNLVHAIYFLKDATEIVESEALVCKSAPTCTSAGVSHFQWVG